MNHEQQFTYGVPAEEIIHRRKSVRTYSRLPLPDELKSRVVQYFGQLKGPFPVAFRMEMIDRLKTRDNENIKLGTYGMIQGASFFIAAAIENKERAMEQLGYVMEDLILYITSLGLGTCWLAGTFDKKGFAKALHVQDHELVPIVTPIGYEGRLKSPIDLILKPIPSIKARKAWNSLFFSESFSKPLERSIAGAYAIPLEMVRLAPSASNKQPWRIVMKDNRIHFFLDHDFRYAAVYPYDIQKVDMGIAMYHFECTAREKGLKGRWESSAPEVADTWKGLEHIITWTPE